MDRRTHWLMAAALAMAPLACTADDPAADPPDDAPEAPAAEAAPEAAPAAQPIGAGPLAGWEGRTDGDVPLEGITVTEVEGGWEVDNGPAVVLWDAGRTASGAYTLSATFQQIDNKGSPHGTGLVFGGSAMDGPAQSYTYFMVRGDGSYLVKTRSGESTAWVLPSGAWTAHEAVNTDEADGQYTNALAVQVGDTDTVFMVNGTEVHRAPTADLPAEGLFGVRLNHNLTIRVTDLEHDPAM